MAEIKFSQLTTAAQLTNDDIFALAQMQGGSLSSVKTSMIAVANYLNTQVQYTTAYNTQAKTTSGAINELRQLISLIPQFAIEVVEELPTEDISDTTIYLVPAEDPEVGNYYEEYIHVNDAWELVGTTAVDLSAYYTKLEVDGLLATKASVTEVALKENKSDMPTDVRTIIKDCKTTKNATITNGIAQFECIEENLVKGLKVTMSPIQSGTGDPSPTNIRPISGRTEVSVKRTGKNKAPINDFTVTRGTVETFSPNLSAGTYSISFNATRTGSDSRASSCRLIYDDDTNYEFSFSPSGAVKKENITATKPIKSLYMYSIGGSYSDSGNFTLTISNFQIEEGSATEYEPYQTPETYTHQYSETIYGGVDDFVNGGATSNYGKITFDGTESWIYSVNRYQLRLNGIMQSGSYYNDDNVLCSAYPKSATLDVNNTVVVGYNSDYVYFYVTENFPTLNDWKTRLQQGDIELTYLKSTPTTIETSAEEITTVSGTNIISGTEPISECKYTELATVDDLIKIIGGQ